MVSLVNILSKGASNTYIYKGEGREFGRERTYCCCDQCGHPGGGWKEARTGRRAGSRGRAYFYLKTSDIDAAIEYAKMARIVPRIFIAVPDVPASKSTVAADCLDVDGGSGRGSVGAGTYGGYVTRSVEKEDGGGENVKLVVQARAMMEKARARMEKARARVAKARAKVAKVRAKVATARVKVAKERLVAASAKVARATLMQLRWCWGRSG